MKFNNNKTKNYNFVFNSINSDINLSNNNITFYNVDFTNLPNKKLTCTILLREYSNNTTAGDPFNILMTIGNGFNSQSVSNGISQTNYFTWGNRVKTSLNTFQAFDDTDAYNPHFLLNTLPQTITNINFQIIDCFSQQLYTGMGSFVIILQFIDFANEI